MVVQHDGSAPIVRSTRSSRRVCTPVASELSARAVVAREAACLMPLGDERKEAMRKAMILENAVEMHLHFGSGIDGPS